jgi:hypothetical protein
VDGGNRLLDRLLQVRIEDYDGRSGWRRFSEERRQAAEGVVRLGLDLFGEPIDEPDESIGPIEVNPDELQLVAYEALVPAESPAAMTASPASASSDRLFGQEGDQLPLEQPVDES